MKGPDLLKLGIVTHFVESKDLDDLKVALLQCINEGDIKNFLSSFNNE